MRSLCVSPTFTCVVLRVLILLIAIIVWFILSRFVIWWTALPTTVTAGGAAYMTLYHGSNTAFDVIDLLRSKPNKDFGRGFYLTESLAQAQDMAHMKISQLEFGTPAVMKYALNEQCLDDGSLSVRRFAGYSEEWAQFILANRNNPTSQCVHAYASRKSEIYERHYLSILFRNRTCHQIFETIMNEKQAMMNDLARELVILLMEDREMQMEEALDAVFNSDTYARLADERTKFYCQSPRYVYDFLRTELLTGKMG